MQITSLKLITFISLCIVLLILGYARFQVDHPTTTDLIVGELIPSFKLPTEANPASFLTETMLLGRPVVLLNVWASWCNACTAEQPMLLKISRQYHIPIYGIDYKDDSAIAKTWLLENGNPYISIGMDNNGDTAKQLKVYGTPELLVLNNMGVVLYRYLGVINPTAWNELFLPLLRKNGIDYPGLAL